ncbi:probable carboxylesterase 1 [Chenopodium quinoa]|uniref:Alpha/beta hydrolase fold-3 domain-containing protein n=1 Tax=Chenopodium quinoa TaxID=63459 RepID=A0A803LNU6_CHEQI|nr:probable carboxylesterase 1 [Chenopodium quinoa]
MECDIEETARDFFPFFRVCKDGHIDRYILTTQVPAGVDPFTGVHTKDIVISKDPKISGRMFLPRLDDTDSEDDSPKNRSLPKDRSVPLLVHYHGGGFCTGSAFGPIIKQFLSNLVSMTQVVVITIDYRLAPENPLPIAYEDSWDAFKWIASHVNRNGPEPWLNDYVNFNRVILAGESTGANLAHDVAIRGSVEPLEGLKLESLLAIHPYFCTKQQREPVVNYIYPSRDEEPRLNPNTDPRLYKLACDKVLICVAEKDRYKERGFDYYDTLETRWEGKVELVETLGEGHCFHLLDAGSPNIDPLMAKLVSFINEDSY